MSRKLLVICGVLVLIMLVSSVVACTSTKTSSTTTSTAATTTTVAPTSTTATTAKPVEYTKISLKFAAYHAATTEEAKLCQYFIDQVKAKTNGAVEITLYAGGSLLTAPNMYDGVVNGIADIGEGALSYNAGKFPEIDLATAPLGVQSPWIITHVINDFYQKYQFKEFSDTHVLWLWENGPAVLMTAKKPVATLEDIKGLKLRAQALTGLIVSALGGAPQSVPMPEMYDGLSKGVVDGVLVDPSVLISFKLGDVVKYFTDSSKAVGNAYGFYITMNNGAWGKLNKDTQAVFTQVAADIIEKSAKDINQQNIDGIQYALKQGSQIVTLTPAEIERWKQAVSSVTDNYMASVAKDGKYTLESQKEHLKFLQERVIYWTDQQMKNGITFPLGK